MLLAGPLFTGENNEIGFEHHFILVLSPRTDFNIVRRKNLVPHVADVE